MKLSELKKLKSAVKGDKRVGRGHATGKGKTAGRGIKGQKAREKVSASFKIGTLVRRLPQRRGVGNPPQLKKPIELSLTTLSKQFKENEIVEINSLMSRKLINANQAKAGVKILGMGEITFPLVVKVPLTESAKSKIEKVGGKVEL